MEVIFKKASLEDVGGIVSLCNECFGENTSLEYATEKFRKTEDNPNTIYVIGVVDGKVIAHTMVSVIRTMFEEMDTYAILNHVCVKKEYRRHNLATKMLELVESLCIEEECSAIKLWSNNVRVPAHKCYKKFGFKLADAGFFEKLIKE